MSWKGLIHFMISMLACFFAVAEARRGRDSGTFLLSTWWNSTILAGRLLSLETLTQLKLCCRQLWQFVPLKWLPTHLHLSPSAVTTAEEVVTMLKVPEPTATPSTISVVKSLSLRPWIIKARPRTRKAQSAAVASLRNLSRWTTEARIVGPQEPQYEVQLHC